MNCETIQTDGILWSEEVFDAIHYRHRMKFTAKGDLHLIEPHIYGISHEGHHVVWAWRLASQESDPSVQAGWVLYRTDEMRALQRINETFEGTRRDYTRANKDMREVLKRL